MARGLFPDFSACSALMKRSFPVMVGGIEVPGIEVDVAIKSTMERHPCPATAMSSVYIQGIKLTMIAVLFFF